MKNNINKNIFAKITESALKRRKILYFLLIVLVFLSVRTYNNMTKSILPQVKLPYVSIETYLIGGSATEMETLVTNPIENSIKEVRDIKKVTSTSGSDYSLVVLQFNEGIDAGLKVQEVQSKINNIISKLPKNIENPIVEEYDISKFPIIAVELNKDLPYKKLKIVVDDINNMLKSVKDVKSVEIKGLNKPYVSIVPNFQKISKYGISYDAILNLIKEHQLNMPLGSRKLNGMYYNFETDNRLKSIEEIKEIPINLGKNQHIRLADIANVDYGNKEKILGSYRIKKGEKEPIVSLFVYKKPKGDTVAINKKIKEIVANYSDSLTNKEQYNIRTSMDASEYIQTSINDVFNNALGGLLSVIAVLFLFINLRESLLTSLVIPVSMMLVFIMFKFFNLTLNVMSIMGLIIALGMLVDNAIVVVEMIDEHKKRDVSLSLGEIIIKSTNAVATAIFSSTITTVGAFIPLAFLSGAEGALIKSIPIATALAMGVSFIVSITVTPVFAYLFINKVDKKPTSISMIISSIFISLLGAYAFSNQWNLTNISYIAGVFFLLASLLKYYLIFRKEPLFKVNLYERFISTIIRSKYYQFIVISIMLAMFVYAGNLLFSGHIPMESMPKVDSKYLTGEVSLVKGATELESLKIFEEIDGYLSSREYIDEYSVDIAKDKINYSIKLKDKRWRSIHSKNIIRELISYVSKIADVKGNFATEGEESGSAPISISVYNDDSKKLLEDANKIKKVLGNINGTVSSSIDFEYGPPLLRIRVNKQETSRLGYNVSDIFVKIRGLINKEKITNINLDGIQTDLYLEKGSTFDSMDDLGQIIIRNEYGKTVLLKDLISIEEKRERDKIKHENYKKTMSVKAYIAEGFTVNEILRQLQSELDKSRVLNPSTTYSLGGDFKNMEESYSDLTQKFIIAALIVYAVLLIQFNGFLQPFAIIICVPLSIIGVAIGYYISGLTFSTLSFLGIVSLVGIAVNDAIVLIDYINTLRKEEGCDKLDAIVRACMARFKPIIATSLTTMAGVAPLALYSKTTVRWLML